MFLGFSAMVARHTRSVSPSQLCSGSSVRPRAKVLPPFGPHFSSSVTERRIYHSEESFLREFLPKRKLSRNYYNRMNWRHSIKNRGSAPSRDVFLPRYGLTGIIWCLLVSPVLCNYSAIHPHLLAQGFGPDQGSLQYCFSVLCRHGWVSPASAQGLEMS